MSFYNFPGRGVAGRRRDWCDAHPREVVPGGCGPVPQLTQHNARVSRAGRIFHAPGSVKALYVIKTLYVLRKNIF